jgi:hypothetical protein
MQCYESAALIFGWEIVTFVELDLERGGVRLHKNIRNCDFVLQVGVFAFVPRIFVVTEKIPGPTVEGAGLNMRGVFKRSA